MTERAPQPFWNYLDLALFTLLALPSLIIGFVAAMMVKKTSALGAQAAPWLSMLVFYILWFTCLYIILHTRYGRPFWHSLGWVNPGNVLLACAAGGPLLAMLIGFLGVALHTPMVDTPFKKLLEGPLSMALFAIFSAVLGPITEELAFRGFLMPLLMRSTNAALGIIFTAIPFGLLHGAQYGWMWQYIVLVGFAGAVFGFVRYYTGSTLASAALHSTYNLTFYAAMVLGGVGT